MRFSVRGTALYLTLLVAVFAGGLAGGYVYKHEPQADVLSLAITPALPSEERFAGGAVVSIEGDSITLASDEGTVPYRLAPGFVAEALEPIAEVNEGARANVGLERTAYGLYLTGVVEIGAQP